MDDAEAEDAFPEEALAEFKRLTFVLMDTPTWRVLTRRRLERQRRQEARKLEPHWERGWAACLPPPDPPRW